MLDGTKSKDAGVGSDVGVGLDSDAGGRDGGSLEEIGLGVGDGT